MASKDIYNFSCEISRYDHSINVAKITWHFTKDRKATIAALFHDIATPVFSHVIDVMNGDSITQESTEEKTFEILNSCELLKEYLDDDCINLDDISDFKRYTIVDLDRPKLCADRLDGTISTAMAWANIVDARCCEQILKSLKIEKNEQGEDEIGFDNPNRAEYLVGANDTVDKLMSSKEDRYMMNLLARIVKRCIKLGIIEYDDLYTFEEKDVIEIIENNLIKDSELLDMWLEFKTIDKIEEEVTYETKSRKLKPLVFGQRMI